ncbi:beta-glucosidase 24-like [Andrographis paniculata]|uniref:beta-glucosidase 24-like n=1 Tax=Andrographis paniculata TaxID=175694 RepID=UPI0021E6FEBF|nr:beta-glucosidase 24-like [Andrographis paniculata]
MGEQYDLSKIQEQVDRYINAGFTRNNFPADFVFGAGTSAYQIEGAYNEGGRALSWWDSITLHTPEKIEGGGNGCVAIDHYHRFREDVQLIKRLGVDSYRFSISWPRILPGGNLAGGKNKEGIKFYNEVIDCLLANGITPSVTLFHWDTPLYLQNEYGGFLSPRIVDDFAEYVEVCFAEFGDRVKFWVTINEPWSYAINGYYMVASPPPSVARTLAKSKYDLRPLSHRSMPGQLVAPTNDAGTWPYLVGYHLLLAHARAVQVYRRLFQAVQGGKIGITNMTTWFEPFTDTQDDIDAASRAVDFNWGWFTAPVVTGDYPQVMKDLVGDRLPRFTAEQSKLLRGSYDFIGMNYYTTNWAANKVYPPDTPPSYYTDQQTEFITERDGVPIGKPAGSKWLFVVPRGIYELLKHTQATYNDPIIYITENGRDEVNDPNLLVSQARQDPERIDYHVQHLGYIKLAMDEGVRVKGYYAWSLIDNFEWTVGYTVRFGFYFVDYLNNYERTPKDSVYWYMNFLKRDLIPIPKRLPEEEIVQDTANAATKKRKGR